MNIEEILRNDEKFIVLDGAMGTMLQQQGLKAGEYPELFNFIQEETVYNIHKAYLNAGANIILSNTFGANIFKAKRIGYSVEQIVQKAIQIAKKAVQDSKKSGNPNEIFVALDIGALGQMMEPMGTLTFEEAYAIFKEIVVAGKNAGADLIFIETMLDIYELKAAILAAKENSTLPLFCTMTFQENGRTLTGTDPETMVYILEGLGVDALGINCTLEPKGMKPVVERILKVASSPVIVKPNAGLPQMVNGNTVAKVSASEFAAEMTEFANMGVKILGGCCGTTAEYINALAVHLKSLRFKKPVNKKQNAVVCSATKSVLLDDETKIIGERINPTSRKLIKEALRSQNLNVIINEALLQRDAGADILDVNVGIPEINEVEILVNLTKELQNIVEIPLQFDSSNYQALEKAVRIYNGKPLLNSVNGKPESMEKIFPIMKKYGAMAVALALDERGLPKTVQDRIEIIEKILNTAQTYGLTPDYFLVDCLVLTASVQQKEVMDTLNAIPLMKQKYGVRTTLGISNISFGLPNRPILNTTFLAMALTLGLDAPICDPLSDAVRQTIAAFKVLSYQDIDAKDYIEKYSPPIVAHTPQQSIQASTQPNPNKSLTSTVNLFSTTTNPIPQETPIEEITVQEIVLKGLKLKMAPKITGLFSKHTPLEIIDMFLLPALEEVGKKYEKNEIFLPQLIRAAETVKIAFELVKNEMKIQMVNNSSDNTPNSKKNVIVLATVKGDIHDIGKNIIKTLLENYNFQVIDLGKDVATDQIIAAIKAHEARLVGLSALMTTTVENMKKTIEEIQNQKLNCKIMVGGAVLNKTYAEMIHADYYGKNAWDAVTYAKEVYKF